MFNFKKVKGKKKEREKDFLWVQQRCGRGFVYVDDQHLFSSGFLGVCQVKVRTTVQ